MRVKRFLSTVYHILEAEVVSIYTHVSSESKKALHLSGIRPTDSCRQVYQNEKSNSLIY